MSKNKKIEEPDKGIPAWIISFTDMVTLLLAFFVLLQSFAHEQSPELFFEGQGSFKKAIVGYGIPRWLYGVKTKEKRDFLIRRTPAEPDVEDKQKLILLWLIDLLNFSTLQPLKLFDQEMQVKGCYCVVHGLEEKKGLYKIC